MTNKRNAREHAQRQQRKIDAGAVGAWQKPEDSVGDQIVHRFRGNALNLVKLLRVVITAGGTGDPRPHDHLA